MWPHTSSNTSQGSPRQRRATGGQADASIEAAPSPSTHRRNTSTSEWRLVPEELTFLRRIGMGTSGHVYKGRKSLLTCQQCVSYHVEGPALINNALGDGVMECGAGLYRGLPVAIKIISRKNSKIITSSSSEKAFEHECRIMKYAASFIHFGKFLSLENMLADTQLLCLRRLGSAPNIVEFKASCRRPQICIVTEFCEFGSLYHLLNVEEIDVSWTHTLKVVWQA